MKEELNLVNGRLRERNGIYHVVLYWYDENHKQRSHSFSTKIQITEPKARRRAEEILLKARVEFSSRKFQEISPRSNLYVEDYFRLMFPKYVKLRNIARSTANNCEMYCKKICSFFEGKKITLKNLNKSYVDDFLLFLLNSLQASSAKNYFAFFKAICEMGIEDEIISWKIFKKKYAFPIKNKGYIILPKREFPRFFECLRGTKYELEIIIFLVLGCRKGEVQGLTFFAFNFEEDTFDIKQSLVWDKQKKEYYINFSLKGESSRRKLPFFQRIKELVLERKERIEKDKKFFGNSYNYKWDGFVCLKENGDLLSTNEIYYFLKSFYKKYNFPKLTPHTLRHTFATTVHAEGMDIRDLQQWLGHSEITTTAKTYVHSDSTRNSSVIQKVKNVMKEK
ncbi:MAG: site-specific integrase [Fusobacterium necrophorum]|nr:site-specific integrase [Fusobacterium necrophorum]